jgi:site-specific recombinase XerD
MFEPVIDHSLYPKNQFNILSLQSLVQGFLLNGKCEGKASTTTHTYEEFLGRFIWFCRQQNYPSDPQKLTPWHIRGFLNYVSSEPVRWNGTSISSRSPVTLSTVNHYYRVLHTFFGWLEKENLIQVNPLANIKKPKCEQRMVQALPPQELRIIFEQCKTRSKVNHRNKTILLTFLDSGLRVSELANLNISDVNMDSGAIIVNQGKGNKQRVVRIGNVTRKALWRYVTLFRKGDSEKLFLSDDGRPLQSNTIQLMVKRLGYKAGLKHVHVHRLRHTFAISFLRAGGDVFTLKYLLGHSSLGIVQTYLKSLGAEDALKAHQRFSPVDHLKL